MNWIVEVGHKIFETDINHTEQNEIDLFGIVLLIIRKKKQNKFAQKLNTHKAKRGSEVKPWKIMVKCLVVKECIQTTLLALKWLNNSCTYIRRHTWNSAFKNQTVNRKGVILLQISSIRLKRKIVCDLKITLNFSLLQPFR